MKETTVLPFRGAGRKVHLLFPTEKGAEQAQRFAQVFQETFYQETASPLTVDENMVTLVSDRVQRESFPHRLEAEYPEFFPEKWNKKNPFEDHRDPNELKDVGDLLTHCEGMEDGTAVAATGGSRTSLTLFAAVLGTKKNPTPDKKGVIGLVGVDLNSNIKAYNDFEKLLFKLCTQAEFRDLMNGKPFVNAKGEPLPKYVKEGTVPPDGPLLLELKARLDSTYDFPPFVKRYYLNHFSTFQEIYYFKDLPYPPKPWRHLLNPKMAYWQPEQARQFQILQEYARAGNMVFSPPGSNIKQLGFLGDLPIGLIDLSNCPDYTGGFGFILQGKNFQNPIVVHTKVAGNGDFDFFSERYRPLTPEEEAWCYEKLEHFAKIIHPKLSSPQKTYTRDLALAYLHKMEGLRSYMTGTLTGAVHQYLQENYERLERDLPNTVDPTWHYYNTW